MGKKEEIIISVVPIIRGMACNSFSIKVLGREKAIKVMDNLKAVYNNPTVVAVNVVLTSVDNIVSGIDSPVEIISRISNHIFKEQNVLNDTAATRMFAREGNTYKHIQKVIQRIGVTAYVNDFLKPINEIDQYPDFPSFGFMEDAQKHGNSPRELAIEMADGVLANDDMYEIDGVLDYVKLTLDEKARQSYEMSNFTREDEKDDFDLDTELKGI